MQLVIDSNIFFSAIIRNSFTRKIIEDYPIDFLFPEYSLQELLEHQEEICQKAELSNKELSEFIDLFLKNVKIIPTSLTLKFHDQAVEIIKDIDLDDVEIIACALASSGSYIWSNDDGLKKQSRIKVLSTKELVESFRYFNN